MKPILLPLSEVQKLGRKPASEMVRHYKTCHKRAPAETTTLRKWLEVYPFIGEWLRLTDHLESAGSLLALEVVVRSARRVTPPDVDPKIMAPIISAQAVLDVLWNNPATPDGAMKAASIAVADARAACIEWCRTNEFDHQYANANRTVANVAAYAVRGRFQGGYIALLAADALSDLADSRDDERQAQKTDFLAVLDRLEAGGR